MARTFPIFLVAILTLALCGTVRAQAAHQTVCGTGDGLHWGPTQPLGSLRGVEFFFAVTVPQCIGDEQVIRVIVHNPTDTRARVRFGIEFTSVGGLRERAADAAGPVDAHLTGDTALQDWTPFRTHFGVSPDPTLLVRKVRLLEVNVCPDRVAVPETASTYSSCGPGGTTFEGSPSCPDASGDARYGYTPLMLGARRGDAGLMAGLVACGSDVNARATDGYTALMFAANSRVLANAELLLKAGAQVNARQDGGLTALAIVEEGAPEMADLLRRYGGTR
jgi:hypothetical protein